MSKLQKLNQNLIPLVLFLTSEPPFQTPLLPWSAVLPLNLQPFKLQLFCHIILPRHFITPPPLHHIFAFISSQPPSTDKQSSEVWILLSILWEVESMIQIDWVWIICVTLYVFSFYFFVDHNLGWNSFQKIWKYWKLKSIFITLKLKHSIGCLWQRKWKWTWICPFCSICAGSWHSFVNTK